MRVVRAATGVVRTNVPGLCNDNRLALDTYYYSMACVHGIRAIDDPRSMDI